ncbi:MAG: hypothetical protein A3C43_09475 [Candidatus Schekmanbacteria bacterium RIFCSPHIGHO2_02_FULL_38_11]|uniref:RNA-binding protein KhpB n=1 Tax=Candidatus Schekmanbacteria bacterium RIFCSPLOWO2_12_FULL_38_15 TaxID=1817883 RepID=A0A1F7SK44_9BACT|nr:MAG: hypothetical protein A2043_10115 [Candidatus Schekmanbacteria bacterium GWA2_38_9]OGL48306.1 MAG: hypothetical protein A3H37_00110 [Candidatus Schekmanbacteria bacterium RIFCSPLOWO2_02_FULL_38_14]OGL49297.1 MAG: hypothetical protein A3C43_09475 [Candidatus Schekmanbacteria bacterium RIFCSPHIGHO2_02_FULL_38_11]OGL54140.1 MAG: hypothetical protein A3G31_05080 [Candidatus Schekmanbacteria bacterium RIFCSPLOWO2_12_FULL_38_15]
MKIIEEGKTPQEAIEKAIKKLNVSRDDIKVEILEKGSKGILGFNSKPAKIEATISSDGIEAKARNFLEKLFKLMDFQISMNVKKEKDSIIFEVCGENTGLLIGRKGQTLEALQHLIDRIMNKDDNIRFKVLIDIEGYRKKREEALIKLADRMAEKVKNTGASTATPPMNPKERRVIHMALCEDKDVRTVSMGNGPLKKVVIYPSNKQAPEKSYKWDER